MSAFSNYLQHQIARRKSSKKAKISKLKLQQWRDEVLEFDILKGLDPGTSFCKYFGVIDYILLFHQPGFDYIEYIKKTYAA